MDQSLEVLERTLQASIKEQRAARRWRNFFRLETLGVVVTAFVVGGRADLDGVGADVPVTAKIKVRGVIADGEEASAENLKRSLGKTLESCDFRNQQPRRSPVQAGHVYDEVRRLRALHPDTKVYAVITDQGGSGGYYIASEADEIFADKASLVGSIGVNAASFGYVELMQKLGVERRSYTSGEHKAFKLHRL